MIDYTCPDNPRGRIAGHCEHDVSEDSVVCCWCGEIRLMPKRAGLGHGPHWKHLPLRKKRTKRSMQRDGLATSEDK
jgi:hypothetical protein